MSNLTPNRGPSRMPTMPPGRPIAAYRSYQDAQRAVDYLSDQRFPVQFVSIVGTDLKMVERVTGRLTYGRVAAAGMFSGAYFGLFLGLIFSLLESRSFGPTLMSTVAIGAGFGVIFGLISFAATGGRRDFTSTSQIVAAQYAVWCADEQAGEAMQVLAGLPDDARIPLSGPASSGPPVGQQPARPYPGGQPPVGYPPRPGPPPPGYRPYPPGPTGQRPYPPGGWQVPPGTRPSGSPAIPPVAGPTPTPGPGGASGPASSGPATPGAAGPAGPAAEPEQPTPTGPTYSEMIALKKQEAQQAQAQGSDQEN